MKKSKNLLINTAFTYALLAMAGGVFYREFTKFNAFSGVTALGVVHTHLFLLGMVFFLLAALFQMNVNLLGHKNFKKFYLIYNLGAAIMVIMLIVRGVTQVQGIALSRGFDAAISGIAGIGHILVGIGMILYFLMLKKLTAEKQ